MVLLHEIMAELALGKYLQLRSQTRNGRAQSSLREGGLQDNRSRDGSGLAWAPSKKEGGESDFELNPVSLANMV